MTSKFCSAVWQAKVLDEIRNTLTENENEIIRKARNSKTNNIAKNTSIEEYKKATSLEALIGFLYLNRDEKRLEEILTCCLKGIENADFGKK